MILWRLVEISIVVVSPAGMSEVETSKGLSLIKFKSGGVESILAVGGGRLR